MCNMFCFGMAATAEMRSEMARRSRLIERELERERKANAGTIKLLLLGAAEGGKSTILKQMKNLGMFPESFTTNGFAYEELMARRDVVYANAVQSMVAILNGVHKLDIAYSTEQCKEHEEHIRQILREKREAHPFDERTYEALRELWNDKSVQFALLRRGEFYLPDCAEYFLEKLDEIHDPSYTPSPDDVVHMRVATTGVIEVKFVIKDKRFRVFDVGGQRSQRKKWIHCFDDVHAVIFVVALSEYDQVLLEDFKTNRMKESLRLFDQVCNSRPFTYTNFMLFLNKKDIFAAKIGKGTSLRLAFSDFKGHESYNNAVIFIEEKFVSQNKTPTKTIYSHQTCATDTKQVEFVLDSALDTIISVALQGAGLY